MLRKDVQIGLSIGGVLLLVLMVYGVVANHTKHHSNAVVLDKPSKPVEPAGGTGGSDIPPPIKTTTDEKPVDSGAPVHKEASSHDVTTPGGDSDAPGATNSDKKQTNWAAILLADKPEEVARSETPALAATDNHSSSDPASSADHGAATPAPTGNGSNSANSGGSSGNITTAPPSPVVDTATPTSQPTNSARTHTVQKGETFSSISKAIYGNARYYAKIAAANPTVNPNRLRPGTVINLPEISTVKSSEPASSAQQAPTPASNDTSSSTGGTVDSMHYRIASGDSLYRISVRLYGSAEEVDKLYDLNKGEIGPDRAKLKRGMVLKLPAPPTATASR